MTKGLAAARIKFLLETMDIVSCATKGVEVAKDEVGEKIPSRFFADKLARREGADHSPERLEARGSVGARGSDHSLYTVSSFCSFNRES